MKRTRSESLFQTAQQYIPGGVNSPVRAFKAVGGNPLFIVKGKGARITDADGNEFIDYVASWGPLIFGHAHPQIVEAVSTQAQAGTEATLSALRLARGFTGRDKIVKFEGCYHGHGDSLLVKAGSGVLSLGLPDCPGIVNDLAKKTLTLPYNDINAVEELFSSLGKEIACLIVEPIAGNMGVVPPQPGFLEVLRKVTAKSGTLLIFDEVITGFRVAFGGAQKLYGVSPDLTCLGKIIGGGLPVGAYGGKKEIMDHIAPTGAVYQAGTLSGNPLAVTAGIEMLNLLSQPGVYDDLEKKSERLCHGFKENVKQAGVTATFTRVGSMFSMFFTNQEIVSFESVKTSDTHLFKRYFNAMLEEGIYIAPSQFEAGFMSAVHTDEDIDATLAAQGRALKKARG